MINTRRAHFAAWGLVASFCISGCSANDSNERRADVPPSDIPSAAPDNPPSGGSEAEGGSQDQHPLPPNNVAPPTPERIKFGVAAQWYQKYNPPAEGPSNVDAVVVADWLIDKGFTDAHASKVESVRAKNKTPYFFGYMLTALAKKGLGDDRDCDGDTSRKLCQEGADWVRSHVDSEVVPAYREAARRIGQAVGSSEALIHVEPDYFQFSEKAQRNAFSRDESNATMNKILAAIRAGCASCKVVIDFSPWFSADKTKWATSAGDFYAGWDRDVVKYVGLTGKQFPFTEGKIDNYTYKQITTELGLPLVVIDAYTFGGGSIDVDPSWLDEGRLAKARDMKIAYVFLSQQGDVSGYDAFIAAHP